MAIGKVVEIISNTWEVIDYQPRRPLFRHFVLTNKACLNTPRQHGEERTARVRGVLWQDPRERLRSREGATKLATAP